MKKKNLVKSVTQQSTTELVVSLIVNHEEYLPRALAHTAASNRIPQPHSSIYMIVNQPQSPGVQWVVMLLQLKLGHAFNSQLLISRNKYVLFVHFM
jgi:hypothetical protein